MSVDVYINTGINVQVTPQASPTYYVGSLPVLVGSGQASQDWVDSLYYPRSNPSGYVTGISTGQFVTTGQTGAFASVTNVASTGNILSNQIQLVSGDVILLSGQTQGLQSQITTINAKTGVFVTLAQTGLFYAADNPSGFLTALDATGVLSVGGLVSVIGVEGGGNISISTGLPNSLIISGYTGYFVNTGSNQIIVGEKTFLVLNISGQNSRIVFGSGSNLSTIQGNSGSLDIAGPSYNVGVSDGHNLVFLGDGQTVGVSGVNMLNVGFSGNTINLNVDGVTYLFRHIGYNSFYIDESPSTISTGIKEITALAENLNCRGWMLTALQSGSIDIDIKKATYNSFPNFVSILSGNTISIINQYKNSGSSVGWSSQFVAGDIIQISVNGCTGISQCSLTITGIK